MTDHPPDDRFSTPRFEREIADDQTEPETIEPAADDQDAAAAERVALTLPPPGLFARLDEPHTDDPDANSGGSWMPPAEPQDSKDPDGDHDEVPTDLAGETNRLVAEDAPEGSPLAGVADAIEVIEQLTAKQAAESQPEAAAFGDDFVFAGASEAVYADPSGTEDDDPEAADADAVETVAIPAAPAVPMYGARAPTSVEPAEDDEILPHFLLEDATRLDVVGAQDQLREMAQQNRRTTDARTQRPSLARTLAEIPILLVVAAVIAFLVKTFLAQAYYIPSGSMLPQLEVDDRVVVSKLAYKLHDPRRGDIVVFDDPAEGDRGAASVERSGVSKVLRQIGEGVGIVQPSTDEFIKRVIALPGERVSGRDGFVHIGDRKLIEPYLPEGVETADFPAQTVAQDKLWVMGDNRNGSADSRVFGQIDLDSVVGRAVVKVWPFPRISFL